MSPPYHPASLSSLGILLLGYFYCRFSTYSLLNSSRPPIGPQSNSRRSNEPRFHGRLRMLLSRAGLELNPRMRLPAARPDFPDQSRFLCTWVPCLTCRRRACTRIDSSHRDQPVRCVQRPANDPARLTILSRTHQLEGAIHEYSDLKGAGCPTPQKQLNLFYHLRFAQAGSPSHGATVSIWAVSALWSNYRWWFTWSTQVTQKTTTKNWLMAFIWWLHAQITHFFRCRQTLAKISNR